MASSICVPCNMPYINNIWLPRIRSDRPAAVPEGATNLGLIGQYVEVPREIAFTIECSVRSAREAIYVLLKRGPAPPRLRIDDPQEPHCWQTAWNRFSPIKRRKSLHEVHFLLVCRGLDVTRT